MTPSSSSSSATPSIPGGGAASEQIIWSGSPSQAINFTAYLLCALVSLTVIGLVGAVPYTIWTYFSTKNRRYELTNQRLIIRRGVLNKTQEQIELYRVRDTKFVQPFFLRLFGVGNVLLVSSEATIPHVTIEAIDNAQKVMESVRNASENIRTAKRVRVTELE